MTPGISVGTQVYIKQHRVEGLNKKVSPKFHGSYQVLKLLPVNKYEVKCERTMEKSVQHWNDLKITSSDQWKYYNFQVNGPVASESDENPPAGRSTFNLRP